MAEKPNSALASFSPLPPILKRPTRLGHTLVEERLAACATLIPAVRSIYRWQGKVETATETLLLLKTGVEQLPALEARLRALHSYQTPEFLVLPRRVRQRQTIWTGSWPV